MRPYYESDTPFVAAHQLPAVLIDLLLARRIEPDRLLRGTGIFYEDILTGRRSITPGQFLALIANAQRLCDDPGLPMLFGQRSLPGHYGPASDALRHAPTAQDALGVLTQRSLLLSPLLKPRLWRDDKYLWLYWTESHGCGDQRRFLVEAMMAAVVGLCRDLTGQRLPWEFLFRHERPRHIEQYWVQLGKHLRFGQPMDLMRVPRYWMVQPCPASQPIAARVAAQQSEAEAQAQIADASFLDCAYDYLLRQVQEPASLEQMAQAFGMSPATLKRKLQKHGTSFQLLLDTVRKHVALELYLVHGASNERVAHHLRFHDAANFRRSFKRWTGLAPSALRRGLSF